MGALQSHSRRPLVQEPCYSYIFRLSTDAEDQGSTVTVGNCDTRKAFSLAIDLIQENYRLITPDTNYYLTITKTQTNAAKSEPLDFWGTLLDMMDQRVKIGDKLDMLFNKVTFIDETPNSSTVVEAMVIANGIVSKIATLGVTIQKLKIVIGGKEMTYKPT